MLSILGVPQLVDTSPLSHLLLRVSGPPSFLPLIRTFSSDAGPTLIKYGLISTLTLVTSVKSLILNKVPCLEVPGGHEF